MANDKKYSAQEAAVAILNKAKELLAKSSFNKPVEPEFSDMKKSAEFTSGMHTVEYYEPLEKAQKMKKDLGSSLQSGISAAAAQGGVPHTAPAGAQSSLSSGMGVQSRGMSPTVKSEEHSGKKLEKKYEGFKAVEESAKESGARDPAAVAAAVGRKKYGKEAFQHAAAKGKKMGKAENPDEKEDAQLGEDVEGLCEKHMLENKDAERKEGHKIVKSEMCKMCKGGLSPAEIKAKMNKGGLSPAEIKAKMNKDENIAHPSPASGQGTTLPRSKKEKDWMDKSEFEELYEDLSKMEALEKKEKSKGDYPQELASENIKAHMHHKGEHPGGRKQAIAIGISQARRGEHESMKKGAQPAPSLQMSEEDGQGSGIKKKPSDSLHPRVEEKGTERDYNDFETKAGKADAPDHREEPQTPPADNSKENAEGNNPSAGSVPGKGIHKLMYFTGHTHAKKKLKKGICLG